MYIHVHAHFFSRQLGAEICGEPLTWDEVTPFLKKFDALDKTRTGYLDRADLASMIEQSRRAHDVNLADSGVGLGEANSNELMEQA